MPVLLINNITSQTRLGVWKIEETAEDLKAGLTFREEEELYYGSIHNELRKKQWLSYRHMLKELLGKDQVHLEYSGHGKPFLTDYPINISVSHAGPYSAAIVSKDRQVGIDIEQLRDRICRVSDRFLSAEELEGIGTENRLEKLYIGWGAKEALYKLHGKPEVEFSRDIHIDTFNYLCAGKGSLGATMKTPAGERFYEIFYEKLGDYMLTYALSSSEL